MGAENEHRYPVCTQGVAALAATKCGVQMHPYLELPEREKLNCEKKDKKEKFK